MAGVKDVRDYKNVFVSLGLSSHSMVVTAASQDLYLSQPFTKDRLESRYDLPR